MQSAYLDNNATTELDPRVRQAIQEELERGPSNPSSIHSLGRAARQRLLSAREVIASYLGVLPEELVFTSSGTEALATALYGFSEKRSSLITSPIEHAALYEPIKRLKAKGVPVTYLPISPKGNVEVNAVEKALENAPNAFLVLGAVNSETGAKNPLEALAQLAHTRAIPFLVDGVALLGKEPFKIPLGVSAMAFSGHKLHGPKGVGLLYLSKKWKIEPLLLGGGQEGMRRAGTENLSGIIGLSKAIELLKEELPYATERMHSLRDSFEKGLKQALPDVLINVLEPRICNTSSITFPHIDGEALLIELDRHGVAASMGSACSSGSLEPSRALLHMGLTPKQALSTLRFSLSRFTTQEEITYTLFLLNRLILAS